MQRCCRNASGSFQQNLRVEKPANRTAIVRESGIPTRKDARNGPLVLLTGCPGSLEIPVLQDVELVVTDADSGLPVSGATVTIANAAGALEFDGPDEYLDTFAERSGTTDAQGRATVTARNIAVCFGTFPLGSNCDEAVAQDRVSDISYLIRVMIGDSSEILQGVLGSGAEVLGDTFRVTVEEIDTPVPGNPDD